MIETDKLLMRIGTARDAISRKADQTSLDFMIDWVLMNCSVLLKEQEERIGVLERTIEHMPKPVKLLDVFGDNYEKIVRCKNCRFKECEGRNGLIVCDITGESHQPEWFCADGERLEAND